MISLDQVYLLEEKVESAVKKIQQLQAENDALRSKCSELTNALSSKTEQLNTFSVDQTQIEEGIKKALERLNSIENSVILNKAVQANSLSENKLEEKNFNNSNAAVVETIVSPKQYAPKQSEEEIAIQNSFSAPEGKASESQFYQNNEHPDFNSMSEIKSKTEVDLSNELTEDQDFQASDDNEEENPDGLGFDIF